MLLARSLRRSLTMFTRLRRQFFPRVLYSQEGQLSPAEQLLYMALSEGFEELLVHFAMGCLKLSWSVGIRLSKRYNRTNLDARSK